MSRRPVQPPPIPVIPMGTGDPAEFHVLMALRDNVEILRSRAILRDSVTVNPPEAQRMSKVSATGAGFTVAGVTVPSAEDYLSLVSDVQVLANDLSTVRETLDALVKQLRG